MDKSNIKILEDENKKLKEEIYLMGQKLNEIDKESNWPEIIGKKINSINSSKLKIEDNLKK